MSGRPIITACSWISPEKEKERVKKEKKRKEKKRKPPSALN
jgi:hypothetical protein